MILSWKKTSVFGGLILAVIAVLISATHATAQVKPGEDFGLLVYPSPLVETIKPGESKTIELKVKNTGTGTERLRIQPREFDVDKKTGSVKMMDSEPPLIKEWITFGSPVFTIGPGKTFTQKITVNLPKDTGFSYSFSLAINRVNMNDEVETGANFKGTVAVFALINVDRPGATRKIEINDLKTKQAVYEYLPTEFDVTFRNTGNTIVQPAGSIFIQRGSNDKVPISEIPLNAGRGYLLPDRPRTLTAKWEDGFPAYKTTKGVDGKESQELVWDWSKIMDFRIGLYTAKVVGVYNDGQRDVPIEREVTFWVIPWRIILGALLVLTIFGVGVYVILRKSGKLIRRKKK